MPTKQLPQRDIPSPGPLAPMAKDPRYDGDLSRALVRIRRALEWLDVEPRTVETVDRATEILRGGKK